MPRPRKWRKVCCMPSVNRFGPLGGCRNDEEPIQMTVDEYETIRPVSYTHLTLPTMAVV